MTLALVVGICAFIILGIMFAMLGLSSRRDANDPVTQEIIIKANTGPVVVSAPVEVTQEEEH